MQFRSFLILSVLAVAFSVVPSPLLSLVRAASISAPGLHMKAATADDKTDAYWPGDPVLCDLILEGDVAEGDEVTLEQQFQSIVGTMNSFTFFLCLRSGGGDLRAAVKISEF